MNDAGARFFTAVHEVAVGPLGHDHPCTQALARAARDGDPVLAAAAQDELHRLDPTIMAELMAGAHKTLREDPAAILELWRPTAGEKTG